MGTSAAGGDTGIMSAPVYLDGLAVLLAFVVQPQRSSIPSRVGSYVFRGLALTALASPTSNASTPLASPSYVATWPLEREIPAVRDFSTTRSNASRNSWWRR